MKGLQIPFAGRVALGAAFLVWCCSMASGQTTFGSITGTVTDPNGGAIPGAQVTVTNEDTNAARHFTTEANSVYTVPDLEAGIYSVRVEAKGFSTWERPHLNLYPRQVLNVDVHLTVGAISTVVTVTSPSPVIDTETASVTFTHTSKELLDLPLTAREDDTDDDFAVYNPGVARDGCGFLYANGVPGNDTTYLSDGIMEMADPDTTGNGAFIQPGVESLADASYLISTAPAEYSTPTNLILTTKSGTNQFHGSAFWDYNGDVFNARNYFATGVPFGISDDFAVSAEGPIKKDKLFFFADWEGLFNRVDDVLNATTALPQWRTGDFSNLLSQGVIITNPFTGQPFPNNQITPSLITSSSQSLQTFFYPLPNYGATGLQAGNWRGLFPQPERFTLNPLDVRIDYNVRPADSVFGRLTIRKMPLSASINLLPPVGEFSQTWHVHQGVLSWTHTFSPNLLNEARAGVSRVAKNLDPAGDGGQILSQAGIQGVGNLEGLLGVPQLSITGVSGSNGTIPQGLVASTTIQFIDNLSWSRGAHSLKFGADIVRDRDDTLYYNMTQFGQFNFTGSFSGFGYADFLLGLPQTTSLTTPLPRPYERGIIWGVYAQDAWKVSPRLTLNYGVRYEWASPYYEKGGRIASFDPTTQALVVPNNGFDKISPLTPSNIPVVTASSAGYPAQSLIQTSKTNFYPRIGVAYKLDADAKSVIRAGYGMYGDLLYGGLIMPIAGGVPFTSSESFTNKITNGVPLLLFPNPFLGAGGVAPTANVVGVNPKISRPYIEQWDVVFDHQIGSVGFSLGYVGTHATNLIYARNLDQPQPSTTPFSFSETPFPNLQSVKWLTNGGSESYNALQVSVRKTAGRNLILNAGYTWAKDLTDQDALYPVGQEIQNQFDLAAERGNNPLVPRNRFTATAVYSLPIGRGQYFQKNMSKIADGILGGWRTTYVVSLQSGLYFTPSFDGFDPSNTNNFGGRPDVVPGVSVIPSGGRTVTEWFNPAAFKIPGCPDNDPVCSNPANIGRFGNAGVNTLEGPSLKNLDFGLFKDFHILERGTLEFQSIFSNVLNHPNFALPAADISSTSTAGLITSTAGSYLPGSSASRKINLALRLRF
jgi:Carboxypeptidase regulatory-like domain/TonB dependent receptor